jgi:hypothetical protein
LHTLGLMQKAGKPSILMFNGFAGAPLKKLQESSWAPLPGLQPAAAACELVTCWTVGVTKFSQRSGQCQLPFLGLGSVVHGIRGQTIVCIADIDMALKAGKIKNYAEMLPFLETEESQGAMTWAAVAENQTLWIPFGSR